jgi:Tol biopolymer transport system component
LFPQRAFLVVLALAAITAKALLADDASTRGQRVLIQKGGDLFMTDPQGGNQRKIADSVRLATLSNDGNLMSYTGNDGVYVLDLRNGQSVTIGRIPEGHVESLVWSPDHRLLAFDVQVRRKSWDLFLASYPPSGDAPRNLGHWYETIHFSPDGKFIVHPTLKTITGAKGNLETVNTATGTRETIYQGADVIWDAQYAPDGSRIAFLMNRTEPNQDANDDEPDCRGPDRDLWILPLDSKKPQKIMENVFNFDWSPDGRFLALDIGSQDCGYPPGDGAVFISSSDAKVQFQLSKDAPSMGAKFSPDSKQVIFVDFNASQLVIGDIATRNLSPRMKCAGIGICAVSSWK